jgi:Peptidase C13 family
MRRQHLGMGVRSFIFGIALVFASPAVAQHTLPAPMIDRMTAQEVEVAAQAGTTIERSRGAKWQLAEHRRMAAALARLLPGRKGVIDAFVLSVALDSDPVFGREAREAGRVLTRRYAATGHTLTLAGTDTATGSPGNLAAALARIAELMGPEDVLILYTTSHGAPFGLYYNDGDAGYGVFGPVKLAGLLGELGIRNRMLLISACYSGVFVGPLITPTTAIVTAASSSRTSFGCKADNDWTFFGDALINHAMRKPQPFAAAAEEARQSIDGWETGWQLTPSQPQAYIGDGAGAWLTKLEATLPPVTTAVGRPASEAFEPDR